MTPALIRWRGKDVRVRHDDRLMTRDSAIVQRLDAAMAVTTETSTLRLVMARERAYENGDGSGRGSR